MNQQIRNENRKVVSPSRLVSSIRHLTCAFPHSSPSFFAMLAFSIVFLLGQVAHADVSTDLRLARRLVKQGFHESAMQPLEKILAAKPEAEALRECLQLLGRACRATARFEDAANHYQRLIQEFPEYKKKISMLLHCGECFVRAKQASKAIEPLELASGLEGAPAEVFYWLGEAHNRSDKSAEALASFKILLSRFPQHELAPLTAYSAALIQQANGDEASAYKNLSQFSKDDVTGDIQNAFLLLRADCALAIGQASKAISDYQAVQAAELLPDALVGLCWAARELNQRPLFDESRQKLRSITNEVQYAEEVDLLLGAWEAELGNVEGADSALFAHCKGKRAAEAIFWRAWARTESGQSLESAKLFQQVAQMESEWSEQAHFFWGRQLRKEEEYSGALAAYKSFMDQYPQSENYSHALSSSVECAYRCGQDQAAIALEAQFRSTYSDSPLVPQLLEYSAEAALRDKSYDLAVERFRMLVASAEASKRANFAYRLAWCLSKTNTDQKAKQLIELYEQNKSTPSIASEIAILASQQLVAVGLIAQANEVLSEAVKLEQGEQAQPSSAGARLALEFAVLMHSHTKLLQATPEKIKLAYQQALDNENAEAWVNARALIDLAELQASAGEHLEASKLFAQYLHNHPNGAHKAQAILGQSFCQWAVEDIEGAWACLEKFPTTAPASAAQEACYLRGRLQAARGLTDEAIKEFESYLSAAPHGQRAPSALRELASIYETQRNSIKAKEYLQVLIKQYPQDQQLDDAIYRLAWLQLEDGEKQAAEASFNTLVSAYPDSSFCGDANYRLGDLHYSQKQYPAARSSYQAALKSPEPARIAARAHYRIAWSHVHEKSWELAAASFSEISSLDQLALEQSGDLLGESIFLSADCYKQLGEHALEQRQLELFVKSHKNHEHYNAGAIRLAELIQTQSQYARIRELLTPLTKADLPAQLKARHRITLGRALVQSGAAESGISLLKEALEDGEVLAAEASFEIGLALRSLGKREEAKQSFITGAVLYNYKPWAIRSYLEAGRDLIALGLQKEAKKALNNVIASDPDGEWAKEAKDLLAELGE